MTFYLWAKQRGEGCDYTIGCGEKLSVLKALSAPDAVSEAEALIEEEYRGERSVESAILFSTEAVRVDLNDIYGRITARARAMIEKESEPGERALYERLHAKFGGKP